MVKPTGFKHTGIFPEQAVNWDLCSELIKNAGREINVLNMFAYTAVQRSPVQRQAQRYVTLTQ